MWIDTHCHLDAPEFGADGGALRVRQQARAAGVGLCVYPAVSRSGFAAVRTLAHQSGDAYALGIHPLYVPDATDADLAALDAALTEQRTDPRLVAVGEIGLDFFVSELSTPALRERQHHFCREQMHLAHRHGLPVILHVRRSVDALLGLLREAGRRGHPVPGGIAHAFNGSEQQAHAFTSLGFRLGFGGALTFDAARRLRHLAATLPLEALVLETDAPDIPPQWLYVAAGQRLVGQAQGLNTPSELPRIGAALAALRGIPLATLSEATAANACAALPRLAPLLAGVA